MNEPINLPPPAGVYYDDATIGRLAERGFQLIRERRPADADALWAEHGLRDFFCGSD